ncbi:universal stress protein [Saccharopolyspora rhizosphaerae]|uniref:Universal stress protein n=1 Tax=Saccharopolyspora rhizosphaerae TaxID=2492662 RepID=A0A3R8VJ19_9PSEU|nr:universal stress protein [Saccharopolyspora rhizosphaerae]RRO18640.1 universal stress protein [Saccharopolyspora rhizosphaerae]
MRPRHQYTIAVGVDGSAASKTALRWAAWHAEQLGGKLATLMAWEVPLIYNWQVPESDDIARRTAEALHQAIVDTIDPNSDLVVSKDVANGHPARALLDLAEEVEADLIAVGNRGLGGITEALLGSVSQHVVQHARCPVVVVRGDIS